MYLDYLSSVIDGSLSHGFLFYPCDFFKRLLNRRYFFLQQQQQQQNILSNKMIYKDIRDFKKDLIESACVFSLFPFKNENILESDMSSVCTEYETSTKRINDQKTL